MISLSSFLRKRIIYSFFLFWLITIITFVSIFLFAVIKEEGRNNNLILRNVNESLKSPISLGSFLEIKSRIITFNQNNKDYCLDFHSSDFTTVNCSKFSQSKMIYPFDLNGTYSNREYVLKMYYSRLEFFLNLLFLFGLFFLPSSLAGLWFFRKSAIVADVLTQEVALIFSKTGDKKFKIYEFNSLNDDFSQFMMIENKIIENEAKAAMAQKVSHDIRSPLSALDVILDDIDNVPIEKRSLLKSAIERIQDIANCLLSNMHQGQLESGLRSEMLSSIVEMIISEKRIEYRCSKKVTIDLNLDMSFGLFSKVKKNELKNVISNIINNSIEACPFEVEIKVKINSDKFFNIIEIKDNGLGFDQRILTQAGNEVLTTKEKGNGLGLFNAKKTLASFGGELIIFSESTGSTITLKIPKVTPPDWFLEKLKINKNHEVVCIDDEISIHEIWKQRLDGFADLKFAFRPEGVEVNLPNCLFLVDYHFSNFSETGIDFILKNNLQDNAILVTSQFESEELLNTISTEKIKMIPKNLLKFLPIEITNSSSRTLLNTFAVLIDNDDLVKLTWEIAAFKKNTTLITISNFLQFEKIALGLPVDSDIYIDYELDDGLNGIQIAEKISQLGFHNIYITSGHSNDFFSNYTYIKKIIGKKPPF